MFANANGFHFGRNMVKLINSSLTEESISEEKFTNLSYLKSNNHGEAVIILSTAITPGAAQATSCAYSFSDQERTFPCRVTFPSSASTVIRLASISALR